MFHLCGNVHPASSTLTAWDGATVSIIGNTCVYAIPAKTAAVERFVGTIEVF